MWLLLNGEKREVAAGLSLAQLIDSLGLAPERIAIELNQAVVRRADWAATELKESDRLEIVHFVGGGGTDCRLPIADCRLAIADCQLAFSRDPCEIILFGRLLFCAKPCRVLTVNSERE